MGNQGTFNPDSIIIFGIRPNVRYKKHGILQLEKKTKKNENQKSEINQEDGILTTVNNIEVLRHKQCKNGTFVVAANLPLCFSCRFSFCGPLSYLRLLSYATRRHPNHQFFSPSFYWQVKHGTESIVKLLLTQSQQSQHNHD